MSIRDKARVSLAVGRVTFRELVRDRLLYNVLVVTALLFVISLLASRLTFLRPERVIADFGIAAIAISTGMIAVFCGASILIREFEMRTIAVALARPISRGDFVVGKFLGLALVLVANWALSCTALVLLLSLHGEQGRELLGAALASGMGLLLCQGLVLAAIALFFSTFSTTSLSAMLALGIYFVGVNAESIRALADKAQTKAGQLLLQAVLALVPDFGAYSLGSRITYGLPVSFEEIGLTVLYSAEWLVIFLVAASFLVRTRES